MVVEIYMLHIYALYVCPTWPGLADLYLRSRRDAVIAETHKQRTKLVEFHSVVDHWDYLHFR